MDFASHVGDASKATDAGQGDAGSRFKSACV